MRSWPWEARTVGIRAGGKIQERDEYRHKFDSTSSKEEKERTAVAGHCGPKERKKERYSVDPTHNSKGKSRRGEKSKLLAGGVGRSGLDWAGDHEWHGHSGRVKGT